MVLQTSPVVSSPSVSRGVKNWVSGVVAPVLIAAAVWLWLVQNPKHLKLFWLCKHTNNIQETNSGEILLITSEAWVGDLPGSSNPSLTKSIPLFFQSCVVEVDDFLSAASFLLLPAFELVFHSRSYSLISLANHLKPKSAFRDSSAS